jgi:hypothetical protein
VVWRWQERFMQDGADGLLRDKTRKPGKPPLPAEVVRRGIDLTLADPPDETTHWSVRAMAKAAGKTVHAIVDNDATRMPRRHWRRRRRRHRARAPDHARRGAPPAGCSAGHSGHAAGGERGRSSTSSVPAALHAEIAAARLSGARSMTLKP